MEGRLWRWVLRRLAEAFIGLWFVSTLAFGLLYLVPGDAIESGALGGTLTDELIAQRRAERGLTQPLPIQYARYLYAISTLDLGQSWSYGQDVADLVGAAFPPSLILAAAGMVVALICAVPYGVFMSAQGGRFSPLINIPVALSLAVPVMVSGVLALYLFSIRFPVFAGPGAAGLRGLPLPALVVGFSAFGPLASALAAATDDVKTTLFVLAARARGLKPHRIWLHHIIPVSILPVLNLALVQFGFLISGTIVTEAIFSRPGLGQLVIMAVLEKDVPVLRAVVLVSYLVFFCVHITADLLAMLLDPRLREV